jgi:hypothetical protein
MRTYDGTEADSPNLKSSGTISRCRAERTRTTGANLTQQGTALFRGLHEELVVAGQGDDPAVQIERVFAEHPPVRKLETEARLRADVLDEARVGGHGRRSVRRGFSRLGTRALDR